jgi:branched-chain amino acid transport system permease protein
VSWLDTVVQGILLGGLFALFAMGLAVIYGVMRLINIAHGDFVVLGAYLILSVALTSHLSPFAAAAIVVVLFAVLGYALQRAILDRALGGDLLAPLVVTYGLSVIIENALQQGYSADSRSLQIGGVETASVHLGPIAVGVVPLIVLGVALAVAAGLELLFNRTRLGMAFRATSDDRATARLMGVRDFRLYGYAAAISLAVTALASLFMGVKYTFTPTLGPSFLLYAFEAIVIGGMGSFWGTFAGAVILGVAQTVGFALDPGWGILTGHLVFLAVLIARPQGLFPKVVA